MTVQQLIEKLKELPPDAEVSFAVRDERGRDMYFPPITNVRPVDGAGEVVLEDNSN